MTNKFCPSVENLQTIPIPEEFYSLTGEMRFTMLNDAMFHIVLEANPELLKALVCSLMPLDPEAVISLRVTNPIKFGQFIDDKLCILDVEAILNENTRLNLELQIGNMSFWPDRSLEYLCRSFDNTERAAAYQSLKPAIHFGIVNFDIAPEEPEFYATYHFANDRTHRIYTSKMRLSMLQLNRTNLATEEDIAHNRHFWAEFFKIKTWEEMLMLAQNNPVVAEAAKTMYRVTADEEARWLCLSMERQARTQRSYEELIEESKAILADLNAQLSDANAQLSDANAQLSEKDAEIAALRAELASLRNGK